MTNREHMVQVLERGLDRFDATTPTEKRRVLIDAGILGEDNRLTPRHCGDDPAPHAPPADREAATERA